MHDLQIPGSYAFAARAGDDVTEIQRQTAAWAVGLDVAPLSRSSMERPGDDADRSDWQNYAVVQGVPYDEAINLDRADLIKRADKAAESDAPVGGATMPEESDLKARWVEYATTEILRSGAGRVTEEQAHDWANGETKANLILTFGPNPDPVMREGMESDLGLREGVTTVSEHHEAPAPE